ncbi:MAG: DUF4159 domain-containing protein [Gemmatimonadota bacterium]|nr:DUF4159 domain-containing protein [Gemmatimonadota bacterium]
MNWAVLAVAIAMSAGGSGTSTDEMTDSITIARLQYDGGGDWYANPSSLPNLLAAVRDRTGIPVARREATVTPLDPALRDYPFLYMTGHGNVAFTAAERLALREYLLAGGFLHADDNYGLDESFRAEMTAIFPEAELVEIPADHPVFHTVYDFREGLPKIHEHDGKPPQAFGIFIDGRMLVFYTYESDLGDGWEDEAVHEDPPATREQAIRMGVNLFLYVLGQSAS